MSIGPMNSLASAAGSHLAQTRGTDVDKAANESEQANAQGKIDGRAKGDSSIDENHEAGDRDADGRQLPNGGGRHEEPAATDGETTPDESQPHGKDANGELGNRLDIDG